MAGPKRHKDEFFPAADRSASVPAQSAADFSADDHDFMGGDEEVVSLDDLKEDDLTEEGEQW